MAVTLDIPQKLADHIEAAWGESVSRAAAEALAAEGYRRRLLSLGQVAELLNTSINDAGGFLKDRGIPLNYDVADFESDMAVLRGLH
jgi:predicted HTH domain antitoxin